jgi:hypothetical protein
MDWRVIPDSRLIVLNPELVMSVGSDVCTFVALSYVRVCFYSHRIRVLCNERKCVSHAWLMDINMNLMRIE